MRISDWSSDVCSSDLLGLVRYVAGLHDRLAAIGFDLFGDRLACLGLAAGNHQFRAMLRQTQRNGAADAAAGAGDDSHLALQIEQIVHPGFLVFLDRKSTRLNSSP